MILRKIWPRSGRKIFRFLWCQIFFNETLPNASNIVPKVLFSLKWRLTFSLSGVRWLAARKSPDADIKCWVTPPLSEQRHFSLNYIISYFRTSGTFRFAFHLPHAKGDIVQVFSKKTICRTVDDLFPGWSGEEVACEPCLHRRHACCIFPNLRRRYETYPVQ